jgi:hypothetical protein
MRFGFVPVPYMLFSERSIDLKSELLLPGGRSIFLRRREIKTKFNMLRLRSTDEFEVGNRIRKRTNVCSYSAHARATRVWLSCPTGIARSLGLRRNGM